MNIKKILVVVLGVVPLVGIPAVVQGVQTSNTLNAHRNAPNIVFAVASSDSVPRSTSTTTARTRPSD